MSPMQALTDRQTRRESPDNISPLATLKQLLTRHEAAQSLSVSLRMVDDLVKRGDLAAVRIGRSVRIRPSAIENFVEARES